MGIYSKFVSIPFKLVRPKSTIKYFPLVFTVSFLSPTPFLEEGRKLPQYNYKNTGKTLNGLGFNGGFEDEIKEQNLFKNKCKLILFF